MQKKTDEAEGTEVLPQPSVQFSTRQLLLAITCISCVLGGFLMFGLFVFSCFVSSIHMVMPAMQDCTLPKFFLFVILLPLPLSASALTMIFCNTAAACRAVQYALAEAQIETLAYHGELNSEARADNLRQFRAAGKAGDKDKGRHGDDASSPQPRILVSTDLAASF